MICRLLLIQLQEPYEPATDGFTYKYSAANDRMGYRKEFWYYWADEAVMDWTTDVPAMVIQFQASSCMKLVAKSSGM